MSFQEKRFAVKDVGIVVVSVRDGHENLRV